MFKTGQRVKVIRHGCGYPVAFCGNSCIGAVGKVRTTFYEDKKDFYRVGFNRDPNLGMRNEFYSNCGFDEKDLVPLCQYEEIE
jgi:hypothetical protein